MNLNMLSAVAKRILDSLKEDETPISVDAKFDHTRERELRKLQGFLRSRGLIFALRDGALCHRTSGAHIDWHVGETIRLMNEYGCRMFVQRSNLTRRTWAMSGIGGITLQRLMNELRIFYVC